MVRKRPGLVPGNKEMIAAYGDWVSGRGRLPIGAVVTSTPPYIFTKVGDVSASEAADILEAERLAAAKAGGEHPSGAGFVPIVRDPDPEAGS